MSSIRPRTLLDAFVAADSTAQLFLTLLVIAFFGTILGIVAMCTGVWHG